MLQIRSHDIMSRDNINKYVNKNRDKNSKSFGKSELISIFAIPFGKHTAKKGNADVAQLARARDL